MKQSEPLACEESACHICGFHYFQGEEVLNYGDYIECIDTEACQADAAGLKSWPN